MKMVNMSASMSSKSMASEGMNGRMVQCSKEIGKRIKFAALEALYGRIRGSMRANGAIIVWKELVCTSGLMIGCT